MATDPDDGFSLVEAELGLLLRRARAAAGAVAAKVHPELDPAAYPLLVRVAQSPGTRAADLAAHVGVGRATISRQLRRLEELGFLTRSPDPQDVRGQLLELTPEGARRVASVADARRQWLRDALSSWSPQDVATLGSSLAQLNGAVTRASAQARSSKVSETEFMQ